MRVSTLFTLLVGAASAVVLAQDPSQSSRDPQHGGVRAQDSQTGQGNTSSTTSTTTTDSSSVISGHVVRYEPGRTIVVRDANNQERTFNLGPGVTLPVDVHVGSYVQLATESNGVNVTRVESATEGTGGSTSGTGNQGWGTSGSTKTPTQMNQDYSSSQKSGTTGGMDTSGSSSQLPRTGATGTTGSTTTTTTTTQSRWVAGTVTAFTPGQSVTISMPGGTTVEYKLDSSTEVPTDLAIGKTVKIQSYQENAGAAPVARQITYSTKTTTHHKKTTSSPR